MSLSASFSHSDDDEATISQEKIMWCHSSKIITSYKYLGTNFDDHLKFDVNTEAIVKQGQQRTHLLCKLNSLN